MLPTEEPAVAAAAATPVPPLGLGEGDAFDEPARFDNSAILGLPASTYGSVLGDDDEDDEAYDDMMSDDDSSSDSDNEFEGHQSRVRFWDGDAAGSEEADLVAGPVTFLGHPMTRFASFQGLAGFMRLSTEAAPGGDEDSDDEGGVIVAHYRLTRFSRPHQRSSSGGRRLGVDLRVRDFGTSLHHVRYHVPFPVAAAADPASSLRLVGAALAADVYPYRHNMQLQAVWSSFVAALPVRVPARATRVVVTVDVGVLPRSVEDRTPERMDRVRDALAVLASENDVDGASPPMAACGLEQHLPAPVPVSVCRDDGESGGGGHRPAKRMKRFADVAGEVCAICHETLEHGLAAWPRCSHVFHGKCLEQLLVTVQHRCPMCRSTLSIKGSMFD